MRYSKFIICLGLLATTLGACNKKLDSLLDNPNAPSPATADVDLSLNQIQLAFRGFYGTASTLGAELSRQQSWFGPIYANGYSPGTFDGLWSTAYSSIFVNADAMIPVATTQKKFIQSGIAKVLKAYTLGTLVDQFGDIPYTEAVQGAANTNPKIDKGADVYVKALALLDDAIADFNKTGAAAGPTNDLFYGGSADNWKKAAKSLKLKFLMNTRLVDATASAKIAALVTENDLVTTDAQDFNFKYGTNISSPDSRHPKYAGNYNVNGQVGEYLSTYFMDLVVREKTGTVSTLDPRRRYYFYRQNTNYVNVNQTTLTCAFVANPAHYPATMPFCLVGGNSGYWGRDHGDNSGTPPDGAFRTTYGVYPAGGEFDASAGGAVKQVMGGRGAGVDPIWNSSFTYFVEAEAALRLGITAGGTARALLSKALYASINKVVGFPTSIGYTLSAAQLALVPTTAQIDTYVNFVLAQYDAATTDDARLNIIMKEYYIAAWGNGVETYNSYRRTGKPDNIQLVVTTSSPGVFMRSFTYPSVYINRNLNAPTQKTPGVAANKVFWDNNPDNFIK